MAEEERREADVSRLASERALSLAAIDHERANTAVSELYREREKLTDAANRYKGEVLKAMHQVKEAKESSAMAEAKARRAEEAKIKQERETSYRVSELNSQNELKLRGLREALEQAERRADVACKMKHIPRIGALAGERGRQQEHQDPESYTSLSSSSSSSFSKKEQGARPIPLFL